MSAVEYCNKWIDDKNIDPITGKNISRSDPEYKLLFEECPEILKCDKWFKDPYVNPDTNKKIKLNGPTFTKIRNNCLKLDKISCSLPEKKLFDFLRKSGPSYLPLETRMEISFLVKKNIDKISLNNWEMCMSGPNKSNFRNLLTDIKLIGHGSFGQVYHAKFNDNSIVIKEAYLTTAEKKKMLDNKGRKVQCLPKNSYPDEYKILTLVNNLLSMKTCPNFYFTYDFVLCEGCNLPQSSNYNKKFCYNTILEPADGDVDNISNLTSEQHYSMLMQILVGLYCLHTVYGIYHSDVKSENILFRKIQPGGYFEYHIGENVYYIENTGYLIYVSDFGVSLVFSPPFAITNFYGIRNVEIKRDNGRYYLDPITCKKSYITSKDSTYEEQVPRQRIYTTDILHDSKIGTFNRIYKDLEYDPDRIIDLTNFKRFVFSEAANDVIDAIRMFTGGKQTDQRGYHEKMINNTVFIQRLIKIVEAPILNNIYSSVKYYRADIMLSELYSQPSTRLNVLEKFYLT